MSKRSDSASDPERLIRIRIQIRPSQGVMDLTGSGSTQLSVELRNGARIPSYEPTNNNGKKWMKKMPKCFLSCRFKYIQF
jgi:hypothetical protein